MRESGEVPRPREVRHESEDGSWRVTYSYEEVDRYLAQHPEVRGIVRGEAVGAPQPCENAHPSLLQVLRKYGAKKRHLLLGSLMGAGIASHVAPEMVAHIEGRKVEVRETSAEKLTRIGELHSRAAEEVRTDAGFKTEFSEEELARVAHSLEKFSPAQFVDYLADVSALSHEELIAQWVVRDVVVYSNASLESMPELKGIEVAKTSGGIYTDGVIYLNISDIKANAHPGKNEETMLEHGVDNVVVHEHLHAIGGVHGNDTWERQFNEGRTEVLSDMTVKAMYADADNAYAAYVMGPAPGALLLYMAGDEEQQRRYWHSYLSQSYEETVAVYDAVTHPGAFRERLPIMSRDMTVLQPGEQLDVEVMQEHLEAMRILGDVLHDLGEKKTAAVEKANTVLSDGNILLIDQPSVEGVLVTGSRGEGGLYGGTLHVKGEHAATVVVSGDDSDVRSVGIVPIVGTDVLYSVTNVSSYLPEGKDMRTATSAERQQAADELGAKYGSLLPRTLNELGR